MGYFISQPLQRSLACGFRGDGQQHGKLITADARRDVLCAEDGAQHLCCAQQQLVASRMPLPVIDDLQAVDICQNDADRERAGTAL